MRAGVTGNRPNASVPISMESHPSREAQGRTCRPDTAAGSSACQKGTWRPGRIELQLRDDDAEAGLVESCSLAPARFLPTPRPIPSFSTTRSSSTGQAVFRL